ncbi:MAG TPA: hypothetical protein VMB78_02870 [Dissulfurispiraceae bacterium]|nr:hypothetical protein [Dissulfurispiraceae bacterium]
MNSFRGLLWMLIAAAGVTILLFIINQLPSLMHKDYARQYVSIEDARKACGLDYVLVPAYFPEGMSWPASFIIAQKRPYKALVTEFRDKASGQTALIVVQTSLHGSELQLQRIKMSEVKQQNEYQLKGRKAILQVGTCNNGVSCSRMAWQDESGSYAILLMSTPFELIRIAESMVR